MFGLFRFYLALAVVAHHLLRVPAVGNAAVFAFFTISGFLMTTVLAGTYGYSPRGLFAYIFNRLLRIMPFYWVAILISLLVIVIVGEPFAHAFNHALGVPRDSLSWAMNATMIFPSLRPIDIEPRLFPLVWTLTVEIFYYLLMGLGATRNKFCSWIMFILGSVYHIYGISTEQGFGFHYQYIGAGALPFAAGALTYHYRDILERTLSQKAVTMLILHVAVLSASAIASIIDVHILHHNTAGRASLWIDLFNLFSAVAASVLAIGALYKPAHYPIGGRLDSALGKYSYPVYLLHIQASVLVSQLIFGQRASGANIAGVIGFAIALSLTMAVSYMLITFLEPAIDRVRGKVKADRRASRMDEDQSGDPNMPGTAKA